MAGSEGGAHLLLLAPLLSAGLQAPSARGRQGGAEAVGLLRPRPWLAIAESMPPGTRLWSQVPALRVCLQLQGGVRDCAASTPLAADCVA